jgi:hypothetical protein
VRIQEEQICQFPAAAAFVDDDEKKTRALTECTINTNSE